MTLLGFLAIWFYIGVCFAFAQTIEIIFGKIFRTNKDGWEDCILFIVFALVLWPIGLLAGLMSIFMPRTFKRWGDMLKFKTRYWISAEFIGEGFDPELLDIRMKTFSGDEWQKGTYMYDNTLDIYVYRHKKTGQLRIARKFSTSQGKWEFLEHWQTRMVSNEEFLAEKVNAA